LRTLIVIPARLGSWRFPNKPLVPIHGSPMIEHVYKRAALAKDVDEIVIAACEKEVAHVAEGFGAKVQMTSHKHDTACDRVAEAARLLGYVENNDIVINVQGDEPVVPPPVIEMTRDVLNRDADSICANLVEQVEDRFDLDNPHRIKAVLSINQNLIYLSRQPMPATFFDIQKKAVFYKQTCVIGFRGDFLQTYSGLRRTNLELIEGIDMLRVLEHDYTIYSGISPHLTQPVDIPEDIEKAETMLASDPWFRSEYKRRYINASSPVSKFES